MSDIKHMHRTSIVKGDIRIDIDLSKYEERLKDAQFWLDSQIMTDMVPLMPHVTGNFIQRTREISASWAGTGRVCAAAPPFGRYLYFGKVMVDEQGNGPKKIEVSPGEFVFRYKKGARLVASQRPLKYSNPYTVPEWFEVAKEQKLKNWISGVDAILKNGRMP